MMLVCEMMESGDLCSALGRWPELFRWKQGIGRRVAYDVAQGLAYLHSRNIVHFDLKSCKHSNTLRQVQIKGRTSIFRMKRARYPGGGGLVSTIAALCIRSRRLVASRS